MTVRAGGRGLFGTIAVNFQHGNKEDKHTLFNIKRETDQSDECPGQMVVFVMILTSSSGLTSQAIISLEKTEKKLESKLMKKTREWEKDDDDHVVRFGQFRGVKGKEASEPGYRFVADITTFLSFVDGVGGALIFFLSDPLFKQLTRHFIFQASGREICPLFFSHLPGLHLTPSNRLFLYLLHKIPLAYAIYELGVHTQHHRLDTTSIL